MQKLLRLSLVLRRFLSMHIRLLFGLDNMSTWRPIASLYRQWKRSVPRIVMSHGSCESYCFLRHLILVVQSLSYSFYWDTVTLNSHAQRLLRLLKGGLLPIEFHWRHHFRCGIPNVYTLGQNEEWIWLNAWLKVDLLPRNYSRPWARGWGMWLAKERWS